MQLKAGAKLKSAVCDTQIIVVKSPSADIDIRCGGSPVVASSDDVSPVAVDPAHASGTLVGKRYADDDLGLEVLCTKAGAGSLSIGDEPLLVKGTKALPSSD